MIYKITPPPITLYGEAADEFLESCGVELYEEHVVIGENTYLGADGEAILNENGVYLYEDHIVLEGQQAEEYKARKAKEKDDTKKAENARHDKRYYGTMGNHVGRKFSQRYNSDAKDIRRRNRDYWKTAGDNDPDNTKEYERTIGDDNRRYQASWRSSNKMVNTGKIPPFNPNERVIADAKNRHMRRHPKQYKESTIFSNIDII